MRLLFPILVALCCLLGSLSAQAAGVSLYTKTITNVIAYDHFVILQFTPSADAGVTGCPKHNQVYLDMADEEGQPIYAAALTAATSGKTVTIKVHQGVCDSLWDAATVYIYKGANAGPRTWHPTGLLHYRLTSDGMCISAVLSLRAQRKVLSDSVRKAIPLCLRGDCFPDGVPAGTARPFGDRNDTLCRSPGARGSHLT